METVFVFFKLIEDCVSNVLKDEVNFVLLILEDREQVHDVGELQFPQN